MYDFNPLSSLFLIKALSSDLPLPTFRKLVAKVKFRRAPRYRPVAAVSVKRGWRERAFPWSAHPSYNLASPADADVTTRP